MTDKQRIRTWYGEILRETGWSAAQWARLAKTSPTNITRLQKDPDAAAPRTETLQKLFRVLPQALRESTPSFLFGEAEPVILAEPPAAPYKSAATVPVLGDGGSHVAHVPAPPALTGVKGGYALYVDNSSMEPRYFEGDMVYVNPIQPPRLNDFVVLHHATGSRLIRRLIARGEETLTFERYNPAGRDEIDRIEIVELHRILNSDELWR